MVFYLEHVREAFYNVAISKESIIMCCLNTYGDKQLVLSKSSAFNGKRSTISVVLFDLICSTTESDITLLVESSTLLSLVEGLDKD